MGPVLAAIGAAIAALMEVTVASRIHLADAQPQIVLVIAILLTLVIGFEEGMVWAFVGGLFVDLLRFLPLGSTVFGLLVSSDWRPWSGPSWVASDSPARWSAS